MRNKKTLQDFEIYENVFINDDLTTLCNKLVMEMKKDDMVHFNSMVFTYEVFKNSLPNNLLVYIKNTTVDGRPGLAVDWLL